MFAVHPRACGEHSLHQKRLTNPDAVHPRACGEHTMQRPRIEAVDGSSPRMRGTPMYMHNFFFISRFIPAHAGNTFSACIAAKAQTVHPRACGEHESPAWLYGYYYGSSPRMRGTLNIV